MAEQISKLKAASEQGFIELWPSVPLIALELSRSWASTHERYKDLIREALKAQVSDLKYSSQDLVLDQSIPIHPELSISLSHTRSLGAFAITEGGFDIGIDLEERPRLKHKVLERISSPEERQICPSDEYLWVAKEACYKSLVNRNQPQTMTQIKIEKWNKSTHYAYFEASLITGPKKTERLPGSGFVVETSDYLLCFFLINSST